MPVLSECGMTPVDKPHIQNNVRDPQLPSAMDTQPLTSEGGDFLESSNRSVAHQLAIVGYTRQKGLRVDAGKLRKRRGQELKGAMEGRSNTALEIVEKHYHTLNHFKTQNVQALVLRGTR